MEHVQGMLLKENLRHLYNYWAKQLSGPLKWLFFNFSKEDKRLEMKKSTLMEDCIGNRCLGDYELKKIILVKIWHYIREILIS